MLRFFALEDLSLQNVWLTIGSFDGVHRAHQEILNRLVYEAHSSGATAVVLTFHPHPAVVLRGRTGPFYLTTPEERAVRIHSLGIDEVIVHPFNREVAATPARAFMEKLRRQLDLRRLFVGPHFALGRNREGDVAELRRLGSELGYEVKVLPPVMEGTEMISSSRIRLALTEGDVRLAANLLGRPYSVSGMVVPGDGRGRTIGIPTANLDTPPDRMIPKTGVYACQAEIDGRTYPAVTNVGVRPTFTDSQTVAPRVETHLLDHNEDLYSRKVSVMFIDRLRDEQRFSGIDALVEQIQADIRTARTILA